MDKIGVRDVRSINITDAKVGLLEGTAILKILINKDERVDSMTVDAESEDSAKTYFEDAILATRKARLFEPAGDENGQPVSVWVKTVTKFRMHSDCDDNDPPPPPKPSESSWTGKIVPPPPALKRAAGGSSMCFGTIARGAIPSLRGRPAERAIRRAFSPLFLASCPRWIC
jgi:hypothetical protein